MTLTQTWHLMKQAGDTDRLANLTRAFTPLIILWAFCAEKRQTFQNFIIRFRNTASEVSTNCPPDTHYLNPRPDGGGGVESPLRFFEDSEKRRRAAPLFFAYLISNPFQTFPKNYVPRSSQVRSPAQVK